MRRAAALAVTIVLALLVWTARANADERIKVHVVIDPTPEGATVRYQFDRPVTSFRVNYDAELIRAQTWTVATPDIMRERTLFTARNGVAFDTFVVDVKPWNQATEATYPCLFRVGTHGLAFYADYFVGAESFETTIEVKAAPGRIVAGFPSGGNAWRIDTTFHGDGGHRYVYIGKRGDITESPFARFVLPLGPAPGLAARLRTNVDGVMRFYRRKFARPLQAKPLILLASNPAAPENGYQGDVTNGPAVALRLFGNGWTTFDPKSDLTDHFIAHEAAHFWNSGTSHATEQTPAWVWEGAAELMALDARIAVTGRFTRDDRRRHIERALNDCVAELLAAPLAYGRSNATYVCGETLFWLADAAEKTRSNGRSDIFAIWRRILDKAEANGGLYTLTDIRTFAAPANDIEKAFDLFLVEEGMERWQRLPEHAKALGIALNVGPPDDETLRGATIMHLLSLHCAGRSGMWHQDDHLKLDTGDRCGPLNGDPEVDTLNGFSLYTNLPAARAAAEEACRTSGEITLTRTGKPGKVTVACAKPLPPPPPIFRILRTP